MFKLLVFLLILVVLFGVEATRAIFFGGFSLIALAIIGVLGLCFLIYILNALIGDKKPDSDGKKLQKAEPNKSDPRVLKALAVIGLLFIVGIALVFLTVKK